MNLLVMSAIALVATSAGPPMAPCWQSDAGPIKVSVYRVQNEEKPDTNGGYDWGSCVMKDGNLYRMWWTRPCGPTAETKPYKTTTTDGKSVEFPYAIRGDRIFYAESRDGYTWHLNGNGDEIPLDQYGPDSPHPVIVLGPSGNRWERRHLGCVSVVKVDGTFYLYYEAPCEFQPRVAADGKVSEGAEYHNQVFLATSKDGRHFTKWGGDGPQPILRAPESNLVPSKRRYGFGQPTVCYRDGKFILHYVDSCTWWPDTQIRLESTDPTFKDAKATIAGLRNALGCPTPPPAGAVAKFAGTDICWLGNSLYLVRPVFGSDRIAILRSDSGVFWSDDLSHDPLAVRRQIELKDPRGANYRGRLTPRFLRDAHGQVVGDTTHLTIFYGSGNVDGPGWTAYTWDIYRADLNFVHPLEGERKAPIP
jgi:hypothetical protein